MARRCTICKQEIDTINERYIKTKTQTKNFMHFDCYVNKQLNLKSNKKEKEEILETARLLEQNKNEYEDDLIQKDNLFQFIMSTYDVTVLPPYFFIKMKQIFEGTYKGMIKGKGIPPADLLDMWKRKKKFLFKTYEYNTKQKETNFTDIGRINYDLAILMSEYDSYRKWKTKELEKISSQRTEEESKAISTSIHVMKKKTKNNRINKKKDNDDISDIIDSL